MTTKNNQAKAEILKVSKKEQYKTVDELFERSQSNSVYFTLLVLSIFIVASGLLLDNAPIVIGGMLVAPLLTPVLVIALGLAVGELSAIKNILTLFLQSILIIMGGSLLLALIFGFMERPMFFDNTIRTAVLYFIVALASGAAATFAWTRRETAEVLPGIAIAVSLLPPLSLVGIWLSVFNWEISRFYFLVFFFNLLGIIIGSLVVFTLLKFYKIEKRVQQKTDEQTIDKTK